MITNTELEKKGNQFPNQIVSYSKNVDVLLFTTENNVALQITVLRDSLLRFRYATDSNFDKDFSYAITKYASTGYNKLEVFEKDNAYVITTQKLICHVNKSTTNRGIALSHAHSVSGCRDYLRDRKLRDIVTAERQLRDIHSTP